MNKAALAVDSLAKCLEIVQESTQSIVTLKEVEERLSEKREIKQLRQLCLKQYGRLANSVLADLNTGNLAYPAPRGNAHNS